MDERRTRQHPAVDERHGQADPAVAPVQRRRCGGPADGDFGNVAVGVDVENRGEGVALGDDARGEAAPAGECARPAAGAACREPVTRESALEILYADDFLVAIAKPAGLLVHRTPLERRAREFAVQRLRDQLGCTVYPAHRLDRATSGVLLFALSPDVRARLGAAFEAGQVGKRYLAIVRGWPAAECLIEHPLRRLAEDGTPLGPLPQSAQTALTTLATVELGLRIDRYPTTRYALVALSPTTGRRHQLRRHLKHISHPIIGDTSYGQGRHNRWFREFGCNRMLLHAWQLRLNHPKSGAPLILTAPPPADFVYATVALGWPSSSWEEARE